MYLCIFLLTNKSAVESEECATRVRPRKKLKGKAESDGESPERKPLGLLSNMTRAPIIGERPGKMDDIKYCLFFSIKVIPCGEKLSN